MPSQIVGLGVDLVDLARFDRIFRSHRQRFLELVFHSVEEPAHGDSEIVHYACVFAIKEAVFKAVGMGWGGGMAWLQIRVRFGRRRPAVRLIGELGRQARKAGIRRIAVSAACVRSHAAAVAIAVRARSGTIFPANAEDGHAQL